MTENKEICGLDLEQFILGELSENEREQIGEKIATNPEIAQTLKEIEMNNSDFLKRFPASRVVPEIKSRCDWRHSPAVKAPASPLSFFKRRLLILSPVLAAAICLLVFLHPWRKVKTEIALYDAAPDSTLVKGSPLVNLNKTQLQVYRLHNQRIEMLQDWQSAKIGDLLQLAYVSAGESYGMIFSIDGRGGVSLHFPKQELGSTVIECHKKIPLPEAIELDDAPRFERFIFLTSDFPIDVIQVMKLARKFSRDSQNASQATFIPPKGMNQCSIIIKKRKMP
jgi:hypothetical protein